MTPTAALRLPTFDRQACVSSGVCVAACPTDCLEMWNDTPWLKVPAACIDCDACTVVCPTQAVAMRPI